MPHRHGPIGLMGAMPEEIAGLLATPGAALETVERGGRQYAVGRLFDHDVVVVHARCGKVAAATTATDLIVHFGCREIIFTGVAGRVATTLRIGDVVIATELIQHDMDATPIFPRYEVPLTGRSRFAACPARLPRATAAAERFLGGPAIAQLPDDVRRTLALDTPVVHRGLITSGDQFFAAAEDVARLRQELPDAMCVEMEGAAVAQVAADFDVPVTVIRTISDGADDDAPDDFWRALTAIGAAWSHGILETMFAADAADGQPAVSPPT
ncbi:MAG: 5'-methylthioadenosine/adenosylhomocysteine nucleosidase [Phycisphaerales bacterium]